MGLVDQLGDYDDAVQLAASLAHIEGKPVLRTYNNLTWRELFAGGLVQQLSTIIPIRFNSGVLPSLLLLAPDLYQE